MCLTPMTPFPKDLLFKMVDRNFPDLILTNARIYTQDALHPMAEAVAISKNRIAAVGSASDILAMALPETRVIDLDKRLLIPSFTDSHFHYYDWAVNWDSIDLASVSSFAEMKTAVSSKAGRMGKGNWVLGQGFNESDWPENRMPDRHDLDQSAPNNPVCIWRCDLHLAVANSLALALAGITTNTPDPPEGYIARDSDGNPTGVLRELAPNLIRNAIPSQSEARIMESMVQGFGKLHSLGITGIHDVRLMGGLDGAASLRAWQKLRENARLDIRCHVTLPGEMTDQAIALGLRTGMGDDRLRIGHLKFFADGGMGARTAWMLEPYLDAELGMPLTPVDKLKSALEKADAAGLSVMIHAIGDRANREVVRLFKGIKQKGNSQVAIPHRIEHVQMIRPDDLETLAGLGNVVASCQPNNLSLDISMIEMSVGDKSRYTYMLKSILDQGVPLILSSDAPVCNPSPLAGIFSAVTRKRMDKTPKNGWHMEQALSVDEAVKGYTIAPAMAAGVGRDLGSISKGKCADMIVLDKDIYTISPEEILETTVYLTVFDGKIVYTIHDD